MHFKIFLPIVTIESCNITLHLKCIQLEIFLEKVLWVEVDRRGVPI